MAHVNLRILPICIIDRCKLQRFCVVGRYLSCHTVAPVEYIGRVYDASQFIMQVSALRVWRGVDKI